MLSAFVNLKIIFNNEGMVPQLSEKGEVMLTNKTALVTGASRGIGAAIAKSLAKEGAFVIINYNGSKERADAVAAEILADGGKAAVYGCNVSDYSACEKMAKDIIENYGHLDILVNNAGITRDDLLMKMSEEAFDAVIATNLKGTFNTIRHFSRYLLNSAPERSSIFPLYPVSLGMPDRQITVQARRE